MSEIGKNIIAAGTNDTNEQHYRRYAVAAALEVIATYVAGTGNGGLLESEMNNLSKYADQIQEALKAS